MALIKCAKCGKDVSESAKRCPDCGEKLTPKKKNENKSIVECPECHKMVHSSTTTCPYCGYGMKKTSSFRWKKPAFILGIILLVGIILALTIPQKTTKEDEVALVAVENLRDTLKSKQSLKLYSVSVKEGDLYYVKIEYSAANSYGSMIDGVKYCDIKKDSLEVQGAVKFSEVFENGGMDERLEEEYESCKGREVKIKTKKLMKNFEE